MMNASLLPPMSSIEDYQYITVVLENKQTKDRDLYKDTLQLLTENISPQMSKLPYKHFILSNGFHALQAQIPILEELESYILGQNPLGDSIHNTQILLSSGKSFLVLTSRNLLLPKRLHRSISRNCFYVVYRNQFWYNCRRRPF